MLRNKLIVLLLSLLHTLSLCAQGQNTPQTSQIIYQPNTDLLLPLAKDGEYAKIADPHVIKVDSTWYLTGTNTAVNYEMWSSTDLLHWIYEGIIWKPVPGSWNDKGLVWAPHIETMDTGYYLYYTANRGIGVAFSKKPTGPYKEVYDHPLVGHGYGGAGDGKYKSDKNKNGIGNIAEAIKDLEEMVIDAYVLKASDSSLTLYYSANHPFPMIEAIPMKDYVTLASEKPLKVLKGGVHVLSWEGPVREGPWVIEHDGIFHLMYSGNTFYNNKYGIGIATSNSPLGKFKRYKHNPIFSSNIKKKIYGPGHHSVVEGAHNDMLMFYHVLIRTEKSKGQHYDGRVTRYIPIHFDKQGKIVVDL